MTNYCKSDSAGHIASKYYRDLLVISSERDLVEKSIPSKHINWKRCKKQGKMQP